MHAKNKEHEIDKVRGAQELNLRTGSAPGSVQRITCNSGKTLYRGVVAGRGPTTAPYGRNLRRFPTFQELLTGVVSSVSRRTAPGLSTRFTRQGPSHFLETSGTNLAAIKAAQSLLAASSSHNGLKTVLLEEQRIISSQLLSLELSVSERSRWPACEICGANCPRSPRWGERLPGHTRAYLRR